jgi:hypothetical protein
MSESQITRTVHFLAKGATYTAALIAPLGDIYQEYDEETLKVSPSFALSNPYLQFVCISSRTVEGVVSLTNVKAYFNGTEITFSNGTSTNFDGIFRLVAPSASNDYWKLIITANLAEKAGWSPATIKMTGKVEYGTQADEVQAEYHVNIQKSTGSSTRVTIMAGDDNNFLITTKGATATLKAVVYVGETAVTDNLTYQWYKMTADGWSELSGSTAATLTVKETDIETYCEYRVIVSQNGVEIGSDIQGVMDATDAYEIDPNPNPADETINEGAADTESGGYVEYAPSLIDRKTNAKYTGSVKYAFRVLDACGNILSTQIGVLATRVTGSHCQQAGGDVAVVIIATI